jgi:hypothetical protein
LFRLAARAENPDGAISFSPVIPAILGRPFGVISKKFVARIVFLQGDSMEFRKRSLILMAIASTVMAGCVGPRSFIDPDRPKVSYEQVKKRKEPLRLKLVARFQLNGEHKENVDLTLHDNVNRILRASGVVVPVSDKPEGEIRVTVNNIAAVAGSAMKGAAVGLTLGLGGATVTDDYEMDLSITVNGNTVRRTGVRHSLYTAIGNKSTPQGLETMPVNTAFERVLEQMILRVLKDMQSTGELSKAAPLSFVDMCSIGSNGGSESVGRV